MTTKKKTILIIVGVVIIIGVVGLYFVYKGGFTKKQRFENCMETCDEILLTNTFKQYCDDKCTEVTGYEPSADEVKEIRDEIQSKTTNTATSTNTTKNTNTAVNTNTKTNINATANVNRTSNTNTAVTIDKNAAFYCEWSWPQKIIYKDTKEVVKKCTSSRPWCNTADFTYANVGCCSDREHTDCITLPGLLD